MKKLSLKKKLLSSAVAIALASGFTLSANVSAIHLAEDGIGQVLLGPLYLADGTYVTKVAIANTRNDTAVKARVSLRSSVASTEILDFICYLTPADVCRFEIRRGADGRVVLYSNDDSIKSPVPPGSNVPSDGRGATFASIIPVTQELFSQNLGVNDTNTMGHIEVVGAYAAKGVIATAAGNVNIVQGMSKFDLARVFDSARADLDTRNKPNEADERRGVIMAPLQWSNIRSTDPTWVRIMGDVELVNAGTDRVGYRFPALAGALGDNVPNKFPDPTVPLAVAVPEDQFDGLVIANQRYDVNTVTPTNLAIGWGANGGDKVVEVEAALAATDLQQTYEDDSRSAPTAGVNRTRLVITFPTRYLHGKVVPNVFPADPCATPGLTIADNFSAPFQVDGTVLYGLRAYNNFEQGTQIGGVVFSGSTQPQDRLVEVNYFIPAWPQTFWTDATRTTIVAGQNNFESGWYNVALTARQGCPYPGLPVLSFTHKFMVGAGGAPTQSWFVPTSHQPIRECDEYNQQNNFNTNNSNIPGGVGSCSSTYRGANTTDVDPSLITSETVSVEDIGTLSR